MDLNNQLGICWQVRTQDVHFSFEGQSFYKFVKKASNKASQFWCIIGSVFLLNRSVLKAFCHPVLEINQ